MEISIPGIANPFGGFNLEKSLSFYGQIKQIPRALDLSLTKQGLGDFRVRGKSRERGVEGLGKDLMEHEGILLERRRLDITQIVGDEFISVLLSEKADDRRILKYAHLVPPSGICTPEKQRVCHWGRAYPLLAGKGRKKIVSFVKSLQLIKRSFSSKILLADPRFIMLMPFSNLRIEPRKIIP
jgi:hypothetical protein